MAGERDSSTYLLKTILDEVREHRSETGEKLEAARVETQALRGDIAEMSGRVIGIETTQASEVQERRSLQSRVGAVETALTEHREAGAGFQAESKGAIAALTTEFARLKPLADSHEQILQRAKGAAWATKALYMVMGGLGLTIGGVGGAAAMRPAKPATMIVAPVPAPTASDAAAPLATGNGVRR